MALYSSTSAATYINISSTFNANDSFDQGTFALSVTVVLGLILLVTIFGNGLVLYTFYKRPTLRRICYYPIISLAMADVLCAVLSMPAYIAKKHVSSSGMLKIVICDVFRFTYFFTEYASVLSLTIVSIERLIVIKMPVKHNTWLTAKKITTALVVSWFDAALVSILPFFWRNEDVKEQCTYNPTRVWSVLVILANVFVPFLVMICCNVSTVSFALSYFRGKQKHKTVVHELRCKLFPEALCQIDGEAMFMKREREFMKRERDITCTFSLVVVAFVICWAPSSFYYFIKMVCPQACFRPAFKEVEPVLNAIVKLLTFLNCSLNPWICLWLHNPLKNALYTTLFGTRVSEESLRRIPNLIALGKTR